MPPVTIGQSANLVLGQPDFSSNEQNNGGESRFSLSLCTGVSAAADRLWVSDGGNARVLLWNALPVFDHTGADVVLGQSSFISHTLGPTQVLLTQGPFVLDTRNDVFSDGANTLVADFEANRVLIWTSLPSMNAGEPADLVLGQSSFTGSVAGLGRSGLDGPGGVWTDGTRVIVADTGNSRVLIWNSFPAGNGAPADVVLGQGDFDTGTTVNPPTPSSLGFPVAVFSDGSRLYVVDASMNRVLIWNEIPTENGMPADVFVGQTSGVVGASNAGATGPNDLGLSFPTDVTVAGGSLFVTDSENSRVMVFTPIPASSGERADAVLGQPNFTTIGGSVSATGLDFPRGVTAIGEQLFVCDFRNSRVLRYTLSL